MVTPDGCPVEAYAALPAEPELSQLLPHLGGRRTILDLGAGTGRIADPLARAGYDVMAVDESAEMLAHVRHARPLQSRIEELVCEERFDAVLLLSHLVNTSDSAQRREILEVAARHLSGNGLVIIQRHYPAGRLQAGSVQLGDVEVSLLDVDASDWPLLRATTRYRLGAEQWDQPWEALVLDDARLREELAAVGLRALSMEGRWVLATQATAGVEDFRA